MRNRRPIRSYVLRQGRLEDAEWRARDVVLSGNFVENVAVNRGRVMKVFTDFD